MDRDRRLYWGKYARTLADKMELRDWTISTAHRPSVEDANAEVECVYGKKTAIISLSLGFDGRSPEENRTTMVHELIHCHLAALDQHMRDARGNANKAWVQQLESTVNVHQEYAVQALADVISPFMPLPPSPKAKKKTKKKAAVV
jgi:hypothetical protein